MREYVNASRPGRHGSSSSVGCEGMSLAYRVWDLFILAILAILAILLRFPTALGCIVG